MGGSVEDIPCILCVEIAYLIKFHSEFSQSANEAEFCSIFPRSPALYSLSCWLSFPLTCHSISPPPSIQLNQSGIWGPHFQSITTQISAEAFDIESFVKSVQMAGGRYPCAIGHILMEISAQGGLSRRFPAY